MMINSMTGYGQAIRKNNDCQISVEIRSVNHRFSEFTVRMPRQLLHLEDSIKKTVQSYLHRGKVDIFINIEGSRFIKRTVEVDWDLLEQYVNTSIKVHDLYQLNDKLSLNSLLFHEELVSIKEQQIGDNEVNKLILDCVNEAAIQLRTMRKLEGDSLQKDLVERINKIEKIISKLKKYAPIVQDLYQTRLVKRVQDFMKGNFSIDEGRILTEVAVYADKSNIDEELTRLSAHLQQFVAVIHEESMVGRKLDFIVQELNRETNTIGSKANDIHISKLVVELKSEIEKIKEQVQNIE